MVWFFILLINAFGCTYYIFTLKSKAVERRHIIYPAATVVMTLAWVFFSVSVEHAIMLVVGGLLAFFAYGLCKKIRLF